MNTPVSVSPTLSFPSAAARAPRRPRGFTLIELLTVIAIIGILAAILVPTVSAVRKRARGAVAASNLRQIGQAQFMYAADNKDYLTPTFAFNGASPKRGWKTRLGPYLYPQHLKGDSDAALNIFRAQQNNIFEIPGVDIGTDPANLKTTVAMNISVTHASGQTAFDPDRRLGKIPRPMTIIMLGEVNETTSDTMTYVLNSDLPSGPAYGRRDGRPLMLFCDGRVKGRTRAELNRDLNNDVNLNNPWRWR